MKSLPWQTKALKTDGVLETEQHASPQRRGGRGEFAILFCSERAQNKKTQPCGAYRVMKLLLLNRLQASWRREGFFRCRPSCPVKCANLFNWGHRQRKRLSSLRALCLERARPPAKQSEADGRSEWAVNYYGKIDLSQRLATGQ